MSSKSDTMEIALKNIDVSSEVAEPHLLLEENSFPRSSIIAKDDDPKRINALIDTFKKEKQPQNPPFPSFTQKPVPISILSEQHTYRTMTFNEDKNTSHFVLNRSIPTLHKNFQLSDHESISNDQQKKESIDPPHSSDTVIDFNQMNFTVHDLNNLVCNKFLLIKYFFLKFSGEEYIPGGFANLDHELEQELLTNFTDEIDDQTIRHNQRVSSTHSSNHQITITRSPIELWQRARILIAIHLYQVFFFQSHYLS